MMATAAMSQPNRIEAYRKTANDDRPVLQLHGGIMRNGKRIGRYFAVQSRTYPGKAHLVRAFSLKGSAIIIQCDPHSCQRYRFTGSCAHVALVERRLVADGVLENPLESENE